MQLRATLAELGMPSIPSIHPMPKVQDQFEDDGTPRDPGARTSRWSIEDSHVKNSNR
jgi:hypothetical protein